MVGDETSDIAIDDTARLIHERSRKEGRVDRKSCRDSEELSNGSNGPKRLRRVSSINALQAPPTRVKRALRKVVRNTSNTCLTLARNRERKRSGQEICGRRTQGIVEAVCASDVNKASMVDLLAVKRGHSIMCFDAAAAFGQALETELVFIEAPEDH